MEFEITEEDRELIPVLIVAATACVGMAAYALYVHRKESKKRKQIRIDRDAALADIAKNKERVDAYIDAAAKKQRERLNDILKPLRDQGLID